MAYTQQQIRQIFQSPFNITKWTDFIINFFKAKEVYRRPEELDIDPNEGLGYLLGYLDTKDEYRIGFFYLKMHSSIDRRKVGLRQLIDKYIKIDSDAGIGIFDDGNHWRLSFITDLKGEKTAPKRYTFVFGDTGNYYRTPVDRFTELARKGISFANIKETFSVEALTKQFYNDLFEWYTWALKENTGVYFPNNPNTQADDRERLDTKIIRLITRLMFVWFIKQKGLVPGALFDPKEVDHWLKDFDPQSMSSSNYYQAILQNLFFATLNRPIKTVTTDKDGNEVVERRGFAHLKGKPDVKSLYRYKSLFKINDDKILSIFEFIPFINGGLFECLDKNKTSDGVDKAYYEDGFSRCDTFISGRWTKRAFIPNKLFFDPEDGIISIFNRYNFTVEENSPSEQQIALDPELLGKVFENLLGVYNPETHDTARNQSGSFYTPREIVNYMVDISLQAYLGNIDDVKAIFNDNFEYDENKKDFYRSVIEKLKTIKVLDPACGSGAFPMGMLNRIIDILQRLNAEGSKYDLKLQIMENCIYGGDIQSIASQITKLRFFISLVCDCTKTDNPDDNYGIPNLPNLETHFVTADSLISLKKPQQYSLFEQDVIALKEKLKEVRHQHFMAKTVHQKTKLRNRDKELREELAEMLKSDNVIASEDAEQMAQWNPYDQNAQAPFFDPEWMFGIKDGFDVVIGNPPYRGLGEDNSTLGNKYLNQGYKSFNASGDIYYLFYEKGSNLLKKNGDLCFITSNKWMRTDSGENLRQFFTSKDIELIVDFGTVQIFESATVATNILLLQKESNKGKTVCSVFSDSFKYEEDFNILEFVQNNNHIQNFNYKETWYILDEKDNSIAEKISKYGIQLSEWNIDIFRGVLSGLNDAFIIDGNKREYILNNCRNQEEIDATNDIIRPLLRGRDMDLYKYNWANIWLIALFPSRNYNIDNYPAIKDHLLTFAYDKLRSNGLSWISENTRYLNEYCQKKLSQTGTNIEVNGKAIVINGKRDKSRKKTKGKWFEIQDSIAYWRLFFDPKISWKAVGRRLAFSLVESGKYITAPACIISGKDYTCYLLAFLCSNVGKFFFYKFSDTTGQGDVMLNEKSLIKFPVYKPSKVEKDYIENLVKKRLNGEDVDSAINEYICKLYKLDAEEISYINSL